MRDIRRSDAHEPVVERLTSSRLPETGMPVFSTIMDLLIFAAGVGFARQRRAAVPSTGKAVPYRIFENNQKEGYIFLISLAHFRDGSCISIERDDDTAQVFEEYAAGGLDEIAGWLNESPGDISGVQPILKRIQDLIGSVDTNQPNPDPV